MSLPVAGGGGGTELSASPPSQESLRRLPWCTCVSASASQSRAQCRAREFCCKILVKILGCDSAVSCVFALEEWGAKVPAAMSGGLERYDRGPQLRLSVRGEAWPEASGIHYRFRATTPLVYLMEDFCRRVQQADSGAVDLYSNVRFLLASGREIRSAYTSTARRSPWRGTSPHGPASS